MIQRFLQYLTQQVHPLIGCTLHHTKLKPEFLVGDTLLHLRDEEQLVLKIDQGQL
jgi:hypothetical protein